MRKAGYMVGENIKMVAMDLDGTLLMDDKSILPHTLEVLQKAAEQGTIIVIATGRPFFGVPEILLDFPGINYVMTSNGARVIDLRDGSTIINRPLLREKALKALEIAAKYDTLQEVYYDGQGYAEKEKMKNVKIYHKNPNMWEYFLSTRKGVDNLLEFARASDKDMDKMQILFADLKDRETVWSELKGIEGLTIADSLGYNLEITEEGTDKGLILLELGEKLGIRREEIMACGDGENDVCMIKNAGFGVAMANARESVIKAADYVTTSNEEQGVAKVIEEFVLRGGKKC